MEFFKKDGSLFSFAIVKMDILPVNHRDNKDCAVLRDYVFLFRTAIHKDYPNYGEFEIEIAPQRDIPMFHENALKADWVSYQNESSKPITDFIEIHKVETEFDTQYRAIPTQLSNSDRSSCNSSEPPHNPHLLFRLNRGKNGKLSNTEQYLQFGDNFQTQICHYRLKQKLQQLDQSIQVINHLQPEPSQIDAVDIVQEMLSKEKELEQKCAKREKNCFFR